MLFLLDGGGENTAPPKLNRRKGRRNTAGAASVESCDLFPVKVLVVQRA